MADGDIEIKKGRKFDEVLDGARRVFMANGFEGASVDEIAKAAGVSKATLYSYFPDKRLLFAEVARIESERQAKLSLDEIDLNGPPEPVLYHAGKRLMSFLTSRFGQQVVGLCFSEAHRFPELGCMFYDSGPGLVRDHFRDYLASASQSGKLKIDDPLLAADQFAELCKARIFTRMTCGVQTEFDDYELEMILRGAVEMFMARYGPKT
ncbi:MAG: TetR family transcriptional regulator [Alphaproteobacteria bacterium]|jgi:AcrR family transcriptional regulator|nr:TetR family transcriptional regulator [Alphaproteobacteria bacterium]